MSEELTQKVVGFFIGVSNCIPRRKRNQHDSDIRGGMKMKHFILSNNSELKVSINGSKDMSKETLQSLENAAKVAYEVYTRKQTP